MNLKQYNCLVWCVWPEDSMEGEWIPFLATEDQLRKFKYYQTKKFLGKDAYIFSSPWLYGKTAYFLRPSIVTHEINEEEMLFVMPEERKKMRAALKAAIENDLLWKGLGLIP